jgi:hypothetical protein
MDPLTIALAIYGGYQGYKSAKKSGASGAGRILGTALGAYGGYNLGSGITGSAIGQEYLPSFLTEKVTPSIGQMFSGINAFNPAVTDVATETLTNAAANQIPIGGVQGIGAYNPYAGVADQFAGTSLGFTPLDTLSNTPLSMQDLSGTTLGNTPINLPGGNVGETKQPQSFLNKAKDVAYNTFIDEKGGVKMGPAALVGVPALLYGSGAFETEPYERSMFTYNVNYPDLYRGRQFYTQDPKTGEVVELPQQDYIPEERADVQGGDKFGPYRRETITLQQGGLATLNHFKDGGVNYLPSKTIHDEDDEDNYMRTNGYVEDGAGNGDKEEDTMLAQLADGEFVTRTDGVLGAGILAGASPKDQKEMRKLGAEFFYEQQKRFKRIYDLLDASRKATAH